MGSPLQRVIGRTAMITFMLVGGVALGGIPVEAQDQSSARAEVVHNAPVPSDAYTAGQHAAPALALAARAGP